MQTPPTRSRGSTTSSVSISRITTGARPYFQCRPSGPEAERFGGWKRILQTPAALAILNDNLTYRVIHMDGRALEANPAPSWMGYSVGRWDGDTLVVDSVGFNDKTWLSRYRVSRIRRRCV